MAGPDGGGPLSPSDSTAFLCLRTFHENACQYGPPAGRCGFVCAQPHSQFGQRADCDGLGRASDFGGAVRSDPGPPREVSPSSLASSLGQICAEGGLHWSGGTGGWRGA